MATKSVKAAGLATGLLALALSASGCGSAISSGSAASDSGACAPEDVTLVQSGRGLDNEYYVAVEAAAREYAKSQGLEDNYQWIASDGDSSKQLGQIKSILATGGSCVVLNVDANESSLVPAIVNEVEKSGAWLVTQWNRPDGSSPEASESAHWVAHMSVDGEPQGYETAKELFEQMGGEGKIVALQGILDNPPAKERFAGLQRALEEYPDIELLEDQTADWDRTKGQNITQSFLTKYSGQIGGVWSAGDAMALGALEAIKNAGKSGEIYVTGVDGLGEAMDNVADKDSGYVASTQATSAAQGAFGLAIGLAAATGEIDPAAEPDGHRSFYLKPLPGVTAENADQLPDASDISMYDLDDVFSEVGDPIK